MLKGGLGADTLNGGGDIDTADYRDKTTAVAVTLNGGHFVTVTVGGVAEDTIKNIERVYGGTAADTLAGDAHANVFCGGGGNDRWRDRAAAAGDIFLFNTALNAATNLDHLDRFHDARTRSTSTNAVFTALTTTGTLASTRLLLRRGRDLGARCRRPHRLQHDDRRSLLRRRRHRRGAAIEFAVVDNHAALTNADFVVV